MEELVQALEGLYPIALSALTILIGIGIKYARQYLQKWSDKIDNDAVQGYFDEITESVLDSVQYVAQTYVDSLKKTGEFTGEAQKLALEMAISAAKQSLTVETREFLEKAYTDVDVFLETKIEAMIKALKDQMV